MTEQHNNQATAAGSLDDPHPDFPALSRSELYDFVTRMFLDSGSDGDVAKALSSEFKQEVSGVQVQQLRKDAALAAVEDGSVEVRRRWIYRYSKLCVNNLVKEQMFMEDKHDFLAAKMELAEEIEGLSENSSQGRLWIAVNDALGRNNIDLGLIRELIAYSRHARALWELILPIAASRSTSIGEEIQRLWDEVNTAGVPASQDQRLLAPLAAALGVAAEEVTPEMTGVMRDYVEFMQGDKSDGSGLLSLIENDDSSAKQSLIQRVSGDREEELTPEEIGELEEFIRESGNVSRKELEAALQYAERHISHHAIRKEIWKDDLTDEQQAELQALLLLQIAVNQHINVLTARRFYTSDERNLARDEGMRDAELQAHLDKLRVLKSIKMVASYLSHQKPKGRFEFPGDRYCRMRFGKSLTS